LHPTGLAPAVTVPSANLRFCVSYVKRTRFASGAISKPEARCFICETGNLRLAAPWFQPAVVVVVVAGGTVVVVEGMVVVVVVVGQVVVVPGTMQGWTSNTANLGA